MIALLLLILAVPQERVIIVTGLEIHFSAFGIPAVRFESNCKELSLEENAIEQGTEFLNEQIDRQMYFNTAFVIGRAIIVHEYPDRTVQYYLYVVRPGPAGEYEQQ